MVETYEDEPSAFQKAINALKKLPYRKWWFWVLILILLRGLDIAIERASGVEYDPVALGFASEEEMLAAFAQGYHTRQKMQEMADAKDGQ